MIVIVQGTMRTWGGSLASNKNLSHAKIESTILHLLRNDKILFRAKGCSEIVQMLQFILGAINITRQNHFSIRYDSNINHRYTVDKKSHWVYFCGVWYELKRV